MPTVYTRIPSPIGELLLSASESALTGVWFETSRHRPEPRGVHDDRHPILVRTREQLDQYFAGARESFDVPLDAEGSDFERRVWDLLRAIPYGATTSYSALARRLGDVKRTRAVGAANGKNPIPIIVPCHRVVGARGELTGFGGGVDRKRWLLEHEGSQFSLSRNLSSRW